MENEVKEYYDNSFVNSEGIKGAGLIWYLAQDHLSPSYNSDEIALNPSKWRDGASSRILNMINYMGINSQSIVLDIGMGIGGPGRDVQEATLCSLYGVNLSFNQIETSRNLSKLKSLPNLPFMNLINADAQILPFESGVFTDVYSINMFYHVPNPEKAIEEISRVLKKGGRFGLDDWFITNKTSKENLEKLRWNWSSPKGFHNIEGIRSLLEKNSLQIIQEFSFTEEAGQFLTEERFGYGFEIVRPKLLEIFSELYPDYIDMKKQTIQQLKEDIAFMGQLYRNEEAEYSQIIVEKI